MWALPELGGSPGISWRYKQLVQGFSEMTLGPTPWRTRQQGEAEALGLLVPKMGRFYQRIDLTQ